MNDDTLEMAYRLKNEGKPFLLATVVRSEGSTLAKPGFKTLYSPDGKILAGGFGGGCPESAVSPYVSKAMSTGIPLSVKVHLENSSTDLKSIKNLSENEVYVETFCGGNLEIFLDPYMAEQRLVIIGQGGRDEVQSFLLDMAKMLGFRTTLISPTKLNDSPDEFIEDLNFDLSKFNTTKDDYIVILTKGARDIEVLTKLQNTAARYVGLMASRKRVEKDMADLRNGGVPESFLNGIHAPIGIDIGSITPAEIAISILSEIIRVKNVNSGKQ